MRRGRKGVGEEGERGEERRREERTREERGERSVKPMKAPLSQGHTESQSWNINASCELFVVTVRLHVICTFVISFRGMGSLQFTQLICVLPAVWSKKPCLQYFLPESDLYLSLLPQAQAGGLLLRKGGMAQNNTVRVLYSSAQRAADKEEAE